jgi:hypothetical protein
MEGNEAASPMPVLYGRAGISGRSLVWDWLLRDRALRAEPRPQNIGVASQKLGSTLWLPAF